MNAKELLRLMAAGRIALVDPTTSHPHLTQEIVHRALSLLAAAEANDGTTPETDVEVDSEGRGTELAYVPTDFARRLERERNGLARAHADALEENARLKEELAKLRQHAEAMAGWVRAFANNVDTRKLLAEYDAYRADFQGEK